MSEGPPDRQPDTALFEVAKVVVPGSLTLGAVLLTAFGVLERVVSFERIASDPRLALAALLPGGAALAFLGAARALGALYDMTVPARPIGPARRALLRAFALSGAYGLFGLVVSALVGVSVGLAVALLAADFAARPVLGPLLAGAGALAIALGGMLTRASRPRAAFDMALVASVLTVMLLDRWT